MFHLYLLSHDAAAELEFLEAVDELRLWEPQPAMSRRIYELYVSGEKADGQKKITVSGSIRQALTDAFKAVEQPDGAAVFAVAYQEVVRRVNEGSYLDFQETVEGLRAALNRLDDDHADADDDAGLSLERMVRGGRGVPVSVGERSLSAQGQDLAEQGDCLLVT
jgi:hypothetical protein